MAENISDTIAAITAQHADLERSISDPDLHKDQKRAAETMREHARLSTILDAWNTLGEIDSEISGNKSILQEEDDPEMQQMAQEEIARLEEAQVAASVRLRVLLVPVDPLDAKNTIMEIRAGTGGDEASLFAADLYRMYARFAERRGWSIELMDRNESEVGGLKEITFSVSGSEVYSNLKYESGVHRVQRIPSTESAGRIHTSAVTVAVLPEAEETDVDLRNEDLRIDVYRSSGPGGQSVNTTDSAVRITHLPTGLVVAIQDEKSQHKNKAKALRVLKARLFEMEESKRQKELAEARRSQVGSGDRSERIRTYNFPQNRVTDHRINLTLYKLDAVVDGSLDEVVAALRLHASEDRDT